MKTISYLIGCKWCDASGEVRNNTQPKGTSLPLTEQCPVCQGSGTVIATETIYEPHEKNHEFKPK